MFFTSGSQQARQLPHSLLLSGAGHVLDFVDTCLLYTSDAADEEDSVDLGGRRIRANGLVPIA